MRRVLGVRFFERPALVVARTLLGKFLVRKRGGRERAYLIVETEAYFGWQDKGSHARRGKTERNAPMFARGGIIYVYFTYGLHWMLNLVCDREHFPAAVLLRGVEAQDGRINGPAKLTKTLGIDKRLNGLKLGKTAGLWVEDRGVRVRAKDVARTPRIGIPNRGVWTGKPWRFVLRKETQ